MFKVLQRCSDIFVTCSITAKAFNARVVCHPHAFLFTNICEPWTSTWIHSSIFTYGLMTIYPITEWKVLSILFHPMIFMFFLKRLQQFFLFICSWFLDCCHVPLAAPCCRTQTQWKLLGSAAPMGMHQPQLMVIDVIHWRT